jgi:hypothetical protein
MANLLVSYDLSCKYNGSTKNYTLKFKVAKGVKVTFSQEGDINKVNLDEGGGLKATDHNKTYKITGPLKVQFFQNSKEDIQLKSPGKPDPDIFIEP